MTGDEGRVVLVVGGGGREHALTMSLISSKSVSAVHVAPGNAGTAAIATNHPISASNIDGMLELALELAADFVVVGPDCLLWP